ncbi:hypothetical protein EDC01DRAFT_751947 [Geopyxis carbonaria]|nr:hypothetical protein EDC01DRAFT_751947 [Geopyxis carbonaria]
MRYINCPLRPELSPPSPHPLTHSLIQQPNPLSHPHPHSLHHFQHHTKQPSFFTITMRASLLIAALATVAAAQLSSAPQHKSKRAGLTLPVAALTKRATDSSTAVCPAKWQECPADTSICCPVGQACMDDGTCDWAGAATCYKDEELCGSGTATACCSKGATCSQGACVAAGGASASAAASGTVAASASASGTGVPAASATGGAGMLEASWGVAMVGAVVAALV